MKTPSARKAENGLDHLATRLFNCRLSGFKMAAVQHQQRRTCSGSGHLLGAEKAAVQARIGKGGVVWAIVSKTPAKYLLKKSFGGG